MKVPRQPPRSLTEALRDLLQMVFTAEEDGQDSYLSQMVINLEVIDELLCGNVAHAAS